VTARFRLQPLLDLRRQRTEALEIQLAALERQRKGQVARVERLRAELADLATFIHAAHRQGTLDLRAVSQARGYYDTLDRQLAREQATLETLTRQAEQLRAALVAAQQDQKALEKLKEREEERAAREAQAQERRTSDEIATVRFNLRRLGSLP
jgi:flagellar export protein FliJ